MEFKKTLIGITFLENSNTDVVSPLLILWRNFVERLGRNDISFIFLYNGYGFEQTKQFLTPYPCLKLAVDLKANTVGHFVDRLMEEVLAGDYHCGIMCEADMFLSKYDFLKLVDEFVASNADWVNPNNRTGYLFSCPEMNALPRSENMYYMPLGRITPSTGPFGLKADMYRRFLKDYESCFGKSESPMSEEGVNYKRFCELTGSPLRNDFDPNHKLGLDAFIRANAWAVFLKHDYRRAVITNYDGLSFADKNLLKSDILDKWGTFNKIRDSSPTPDTEGVKIQCPFFHLGHGFMTSIYFATSDPNLEFFKTHWFDKFGLGERSDIHFAITELIAELSASEPAINCIREFKRTYCSKLDGSFVSKVKVFYSEAFDDYRSLTK